MTEALLTKPQPKQTAGSTRSEYDWTDSVWLCLAISLIVGFLYALVMMGPGPLNPHNLGWMVGDPAEYYTAWELFRQDPHWHWPLTYTNRVGYPMGENVALMDPVALYVVLLKPLSPLLPEPFQFFGLEVAAICALLFFFAMRLFRLFLGPNPIGIILCSLFFLTSPPLTWNLTRHFALSNHWLLVAALFLYFKAQQDGPRAVRRFVISALLLAAAAVATNPYIAFPTLLVLTATAASLLWQRRLSLSRAVGFMAALGVTSAVVAYALGFFIRGGKGYTVPGYRVYALNLLAPFDPYIYGSILPRLLPRFPHGPIDIGCSYLGAGIIFLAILLAILFAFQPAKRPSLNKRQVLPLFLCCLVLTLLALSTKVMIGTRTLVDVDPQQHLTRFLGPLKTSLTLFWFPNYAILLAVLAPTYLFFRRSQANWLLAIMLVVQVVDIIPLLKWSHSRAVPSEIDGFWKPKDWQPLKSPIWSELGSLHQNLVVLPAWQCGALATPGGLDGYRIFGFLAVAQNMRTNSYRSSRYTEVNREFHCRQAIAALGEQPLSPDTAYVVTPSLAEVIAKGPTGPGKCHELDGFILCSTKVDFGAGAAATP